MLNRAMVMEEQSMWWSDDGKLSFKICEEDDDNKLPVVKRECCACDDAKYKVSIIFIF